MYDQPTKIELIEAVRSFLETKAMPALDKHMAFHARVAANALAIVQRELEQGSEQTAVELERLRDLLKKEGTLEELNRELCRRIRSGDVPTDAPGLKEHLWETTLAKLAVDQPKYATYRREVEKGRGIHLD